ncbi:hypothetical protein FS837_006336, partial [Tulasnella sp. UAMH 9824]
NAPTWETPTLLLCFAPASSAAAILKPVDMAWCAARGVPARAAAISDCGPWKLQASMLKGSSSVSSLLTQVSSDINRLDAQETIKKPIPITLSYYTVANFLCERVQRYSSKAIRATFSTNNDTNSDTNSDTSNRNSNTSNVLSALYLQLPGRLARPRPVVLLGASAAGGNLGPSSELADLRKERMVVFSSVPVPRFSYTGTSSTHGGTGTPIQTFPAHSSGSTAVPGSSVSAGRPSTLERRFEIDHQDKEEGKERNPNSGGTADRHAGGGLSRSRWSIGRFSVLTIRWETGKPPTPAQSRATEGDPEGLLRQPTYDPV